MLIYTRQPQIIAPVSLSHNSLLYIYFHLSNQQNLSQHTNLFHSDRFPTRKSVSICANCNPVTKVKPINMASPNDVHSQELQPYIGEDTFDAFIDLDFLRNNHSSMDEDVDIGAMSNSDLFRYFLEGELVKPDAIDIEPSSNSFPAPMQDVTNDFT